MNNKKRIIELIIVVSIILLVTAPLIGLSPAYDENGNRIPFPEPAPRTTDFFPEEYIGIIAWNQPDGTKLLLSAVFGDENNNVTLYSIDGYTVIQDPETRFWCWARQSEEGDLESTGLPVHTHDPDELGLEKNIRMSRERAFEQMQRIWEDNQRTRGNYHFNQDLRNIQKFCPTEAPLSNPVNKIVINISFADQDSNYTFPSTLHETRFNDLTNYYKDVSYNKLHTQIHYYAFRDTTISNHIITSQPGIERDNRERFIIFKIISENLQTVPFNVDINNDDAVDNVTVVFRGISGPLAYDGYYQANNASFNRPTINGKLVENFIVLYESNMLGNRVGLITMAHEFGHNLGFPDLYSRFGNEHPIGPWCIMSNSWPSTLNSSLPSVSAYLKYKYTNWFTQSEIEVIVPNVVLGSSTNTIQPLMGNSPGPKVYIVKSQYPNVEEYFVLENRNTSSHSTVDRSLPGSGMLIYRVNPNIRGNILGSIFELYVFRPNATEWICYADGSINSAPYPRGGSTYLDQFYLNDLLNFNYAMLSDFKPSGISIERITRNSNNDGVSFRHYNYDVYEFYVNPPVLPLDINRVMNGGKIEVLYHHDYWDAWINPFNHFFVRQYQFWDPFKLLGKSITLEFPLQPNNHPIIPNEHTHIFHFEDELIIKYLHGPAIFKNIVIEIRGKVDTKNANIIFNNSPISINGQNVSELVGDANRLERSFIKFGRGSTLNVSGGHEVRISNYDLIFEDENLIQIEQGSLLITDNVNFIYTNPSITINSTNVHQFNNRNLIFNNSTITIDNISLEFDTNMISFENCQISLINSAEINLSNSLLSVEQSIISLDNSLLNIDDRSTFELSNGSTLSLTDHSVVTIQNNSLFYLLSNSIIEGESVRIDDYQLGSRIVISESSANFDSNTMIKGINNNRWAGIHLSIVYRQ